MIVVNHHLLLADVAVRRMSGNWEDAAVLPPYARLVVDEGHHLEDAAAAHLGTTVTRRALDRLFSRLERRGKGLLPTLATRLEARRDLLSVASLDLVHSRLFRSTHAAREKSGIILTNPDMLHAWILPHHTAWARTLQNLKYIVVDELHTYKGVFGSHVANVIRRLMRIARFHGSDPILIGATATIGNPAEHA